MHLPPFWNGFAFLSQKGIGSPHVSPCHPASQLSQAKSLWPRLSQVPPWVQGFRFHSQYPTSVSQFVPDQPCEHWQEYVFRPLLLHTPSLRQGLSFQSQYAVSSAQFVPSQPSAQLAHVYDPAWLKLVHTPSFWHGLAFQSQKGTAEVQMSPVHPAVQLHKKTSRLIL